MKFVIGCRNVHNKKSAETKKQEEDPTSSDMDLDINTISSSTPIASSSTTKTNKSRKGKTSNLEESDGEPEEQLAASTKSTQPTEVQSVVRRKPNARPKVKTKKNNKRKESKFDDVDSDLELRYFISLSTPLARTQYECTFCYFVA